MNRFGAAPITLLVALSLPVLADDLTPAQRRLIALLTYVQVSRDRCGYLIDVDVLRRTAAREGVTFQTEAETRARDEGFAEAERAFIGVRGPVECAYALERFGPSGSEFAGLIERKLQFP